MTNRNEVLQVKLKILLPIAAVGPAVYSLFKSVSNILGH